MEQMKRHAITGCFLLIILSIVVYGAIVKNDVAQVSGFTVLLTYIVKKIMDLIDELLTGTVDKDDQKGV